jgi:hypothetical protein
MRKDMGDTLVPYTDYRGRGERREFIWTVCPLEPELRREGEGFSVEGNRKGFGKY